MKIINKIPLWMLLCLFSFSHATETALSSALPAIADNFNASGSKAQMCSTIYFLGFAAGILSLGRVSDIYGRKPVVIGGMILYLLASFCCIFAPNIETLIFLRFIQAFGASVGSVIGQAMARDSYEGKELSYIYASLSMGLALVPSLASAAGGYIVEYSGWRHIFAILTLSSSLLIIIYFKLMPETNSYVGTGKMRSYFSVIKVVLRDKILLLYAFIIGAFNGMLAGFYMEAPFIFIDQVGLTPSIYGKFAFLLGAAHLLGSGSSRYLVKNHVDTKKIMLVGLILSFIGCSSLIIFTHFIAFNYCNKYLDIIVIFIPIMLHILGHSIFVPLSLRYALEDYSKVTGTAGSIFGSLYYFIVAIISFIISLIHNDHSITNFTILFFILSSLCFCGFYLIRRLEQRNNNFIKFSL